MLIIVCHFVLFLLAIVLSVLLPYTDSDYLFGIFKLFWELLALLNVLLSFQIYRHFQFGGHIEVPLLHIKHIELFFTVLILFQYAKPVNNKLFFMDLHCKSKIVDSNVLICSPAMSVCFVFGISRSIFVMFLFNLFISLQFSEDVDFNSSKHF